MGRIAILITSITKSKQTIARGAPSGMRCAMLFLGLLNHEKMLNEIQSVKPSQNTIEIWEDKGKLKEFTDIKLIEINMKKTEQVIK